MSVAAARRTQRDTGEVHGRPPLREWNAHLVATVDASTVTVVSASPESLPSEAMLDLWIWRMRSICSRAKTTGKKLVS